MQLYPTVAPHPDYRKEQNGACNTSSNCTVIATPLAYPQDTSTTDTRQNVHQKNTGSGESVNFNDAQNLYKAGVDEQECEFED